MRTSLTCHVALLRGINVGGKNKLPMADLAELFRRAGCSCVRTYIQSGNVVFAADAKVAGRLTRSIPEAIKGEFGLQVPVVLRSLPELEEVVRGNPFLQVATDEKELHVGFLSTEPASALIASLDPLRSPPDEFHVRGREIYLRLPHGMGRSKLTNAWFDSRLATISTFRNWNTTCRLLEMLREEHSEG